jgi:hypothetical protein
MQSTTSSNLAQVVKLVVRHLRNQKRRVPSIELLQQLIEKSFYASMKSEESRRIVCTLAFVEPKNPAGKDPRRIRPQRRSYVAFKDLIPFDIRNLVKLSQAAPPWASCVAVCGNNHQLFICGLFDQEVHHRNSLNHEEGDRFGRPGLFQIEITGVGSLAIHDNWQLIATLNQNNLVRTFHDVLRTGPVAKALANLSSKQQATVRQLLKDNDVPAPKWRWQSELAELWMRTLSRILLNIKRSGHGGALLLTPQQPTRDLKIKYEITYPKLDTVLPEHIAGETREEVTREIIDEQFLDALKDEMPTDLYLAEAISAGDKEDAIKAELGCVNFIASLTRVDGCVLLSSGLNVRGFGVEITCRKNPPIVFTAGDERASNTKLRQLDFSHFGTRHRSMMRYCYSNLGSVGFVISQDGDVRAIMRIGKKLVLWENVRLQDVEIVKYRVAQPR